MKRKVLFKIIFGYILFGIMAFAVVFFYSGTALNEYLIKHEATILYAEAIEIADSYATDYYEDDISLTGLQRQLTILSPYLDSTIMAISTTGEVIASSDSDPSEPARVIENFDPTTSGSDIYQLGSFYGTFSENMISVMAPITANYKVRGYITLHKTVSAVTSDTDRQINIIYFTLALILLCGLLILILFLAFIYRPLNSISKVAKSYASGNYDTPSKYTGTDEFGLIGGSLNYMATELNTLEDDQRKFISNVSHDFRSPLTSIKGYITAILDGTIPTEMQEKYLNVVLFETERLTKLTQNLLDLNKIGSKSTIMDITSFDINTVIKNTAMSFEGIGLEKGISLDLILTGESAYVSADMSKIQQVLYNLLDNAIKFSNDNSVVTIETTERNGKLYVSVRDNGIGIPKESISKVWERFYKTDLSRGRDKKGTGLGLAIVKEIILAHDENINVVSTEGVGTEFTFTLTLSKE
ncbi:MAG: HAMP domain-containing protein [Eubacterium sp.]|nr:HAMP domain-containing protein [Eubacterium sp.]